MEVKPIYPSIKDPNAEIWLLTGPRWAGFIQQALRTAQDSIFFSLYLLSPHWGRAYQGATNLLQEICRHGKRLNEAGKTCRVILGHPNKSAYTATFNLEAAGALAKAGWAIRIMPAKRVLHEKIWIFDKQIVVVGSHNVSVSSALTNLDCSIAINSELVASELMTNWWKHWNLAEPYRETGAPHGTSNKPNSTNGFTGRFKPDSTNHKRRII